MRLSGLAELPFDLYIKAESEQPIGSFKLRGAYNRIAQLSPDELGRGVITYSSGNHAQGVAYAARALDARAVIVMPENAPAIKIEATKALGAEIVLVGPASSERRAKAEELARTHGYSIIPPYDDAAIIAGQGTCGLEILEQLGVIGPDASKAPGANAGGGVVVLSPVSGGGLLSGIAAAVKLAAPPQWEGRIEVWGAEPELAADAKESFDTKTLVEWPAEMTTRTRCDGLRTQSLGELNFAHILRFVDGIVTVSEDQILAAMRGLLATTGLVAEPSGAVTLAAALFHHAELPRCQRLVAVLSGGNIEPELRRELDAGAARAASA
jgi:threonine dehydratase